MQFDWLNKRSGGGGGGGGGGGQEIIMIINSMSTLFSETQPIFFFQYLLRLHFQIFFVDVWLCFFFVRVNNITAPLPPPSCQSNLSLLCIPYLWQQFGFILASIGKTVSSSRCFSRSQRYVLGMGFPYSKQTNL